MKKSFTIHLTRLSLVKSTILGFILFAGVILFPWQTLFAAGWTQITSNPSSGFDAAYSIAVDSSGIYVAGIDQTLGNNQWRIEKRGLTNGAVLWKQTNNPSGGSDDALGITVDSSGIYVAGFDSAPGNAQWRIEKRNLTTGALLTSFDGDGIVTSNPSSGFDAAYSIAVDSSGIYVAGIDQTLGNNQWRIEKRGLTNGAVLWTQTNNPSSGFDAAYSIAVDSSGIYVAGFDKALGDDQWRIEKRNLTNGNLMWTRINNPSGGQDVAYSIAVDSSGIYVAGIDRAPGNAQWRIEKRNLTNGNLMWTRINNPSGGSDDALGITVDSSGIYVAGFDSAPGNAQWRIENISATLTVAKTGTGSGTVTSVPVGISCGADCSEVYGNGTSVTLVASASSGSTFTGWSGACSGATECLVNMDADKAVTANFNLIPRTLTVSKSGSGSGTVTSSPAGINCGATCSTTFSSGASVTLTATAASGSTFTGWSGACSGTGSCVVTMNSNQSATATFNANAPSVSTNPVSSVTTTDAALNGSANPNGLTTSAWFEWGTSASLSTYNTTSPSQNLGSGTLAVSYSTSLSGLSPGTTYYFRAAASSSAGTTKGTILNFTTDQPPIAGVSVAPTNLTVTSGDPCVAALQPTLSWDLSAAMWFSKGWAWSSNIRWISFNSSNCDTDKDGTSNGGSGCPASGTAMSAYSVKIDSANGNFSGYAWSSRIGWIAFGDYNADGKIDSSDESISGAPCSGNCRAKLNLSNNQVTGWARVLRYKSFGGDRGWIKLSGTATNGSTYGIYKNGNNLEGWVWGSENIGWISFNSTNAYSGKIPGANYGVAVVAPTQIAYQVQVDSDPVFPFPAEVDSTKVISSGRTFTANVPNYGTTYYWRVMIWDTENSESSWVNGPSFGTAAHQYPRVDFEWTPKTPSALETVEFKDKSIVYGGTSISDWFWTFQDAICKTPAANCESVQNPKITFNEVAEKSNKSVSLKVTDSDGFSCTLNKSMPVNVKLPEIKEVAPKR